MIESTLIDYTFNSGVGVIKMNNPPLNLGNTRSMGQLDAILEKIENDPAVRAVVLCATGKVFAAGSDMKEIATHLKDGSYVDSKMVNELRIRNRIANLPVPTIAAMDGSAYGGGLDLALSCDMRIAAPHIVLSLPEVTLGSFP